MATRSSHFAPTPTIEDKLAKEMALLKIDDERRRKEVERICS